MLKKQRQEVFLAGLLHDIGKFWQRGDDWLSSSQNLSNDVKGLIGFLCPERDGRPQYQHVLWTYQFFESFKQKFKELGVMTSSSTERDDDNLVNLAIYHHKPQSEMQALIQLADWWSSGIDRRKEITQREKVSFGKYKFKKVPLHSLFSEVNTAVAKGDATQRDVYSLKALNIDDSDCCFPTHLTEANVENFDMDYNVYWEAFAKEVTLLPTDNLEVFTESLLFLLKKYTWCIPSSTTDMANVSLFEHLKSTAAIADCLFAYKTAKPDAFDYKDQRLKLKEGEMPLLMFCCDISGIQNFIYNIASRKAAMSLKGRSFYLQMLVDAIIEKIIHETETTLGHVIYSSGGKFYMLLPNTEDVVKKLEKLQKDLAKQLWEEQRGKIHACLAWIPFAYQNNSKDKDLQIFTTETQKNGNSIENLGELWAAVSDKAAEQKGRKYEHLMLSNFNTFFEPSGKGDLKICAVTGEEMEKVAKLERRNSNEVIEVLPIVKQQADLGRQLKDAHYWATSLDDVQNIVLLKKNREGYIQPLGIGVHQYLLGENEVRKVSSADNVRLRKINNTDFLSNTIKGNNNAYGFSFYGGNRQALTERGDEKLFEELAGDTYLGILKLDVDGLGAIFKDGFENTNKTFSAYATLSASLDYFFSGYINTIRAKYADDVNIIYSGGDDLFAVGRWDKLILFAADVRSEFRRFVGNREDISISAGISFCGQKYPISLAAKQADEYEQMAKNHQSKNVKVPQKNALCFFGESINWEKEYDYVRGLMLQFYWFCGEKEAKLSKGFLQKMMSLKSLKDSMIAEQGRTKDHTLKNKNDYSYRWNSAYYVRRVMEKYIKKDTPDKAKVFDFLDKHIKEQLFTSDREFDLIALAARWAEYYIKEELNPNH